MEGKESKSRIVQFRLKESEFKQFKKLSEEKGYSSLSALIRFSLEQLLKHGVKNG